MILSEALSTGLGGTRSHSGFHLINIRKIMFILVGCLSVTWQPVLAQDPDLQTTVKMMQELLKEQQKQLDEQRKELAAQRLLIKQLQGDSKSKTAPTDVPDVVYPDTETTDAIAQEAEPDTVIPDEDQSGQQQAVIAMAAKEGVGPQTEEQKEQDQAEIARKTFYDPSNTVYDRNFPGAWYLPGTTAAMKIGGYVNLSFVHSFDPLLIPDRFIVGSIPPEGQTVPGAVEGTQVSAQQTRINWEYREQTKPGEIRAFVEGDFQGTNETFRLRHAFGQFRTILAGKTWSTFMDVDSQPEEVDVEGINGQVLRRQSQIRWFPQFGEHYNLKIAVEDPATDIYNAQEQKGAFDLVASLNRMPLGPLGRWNYRVGVILRELRAIDSETGSDDSLPTESATGWGITTGGRQPMTRWGEGDYILWQLTYGKGIGRYINDLSSVGGGDAVFDPDSNLRALPVFSGYFSYMHRWPMKRWFLKTWPGILRSSLTFSWVDINNYDFQEDGAYDRTMRASINLMYNPTQHIQAGFEYLWGERKNKDGSKGTATQFQFAMRYIF